MSKNNLSTDVCSIITKDKQGASFGGSINYLQTPETLSQRPADISPLEEAGVLAARESDKLSYIQFANLSKYSNSLTHCFTTRLGGTSTGEYSSLNLGLFTQDNFENIKANYEIISNELGFDTNNIVFSRQVHDNKVRIVEKADYSNNLANPYLAPEFDAMITASKNVVLTAFFADCVPVFFYDPISNVIAIAHSGWKSTIKNINRKVVECLIKNFNTKVESLEIAIGPSLGICCFEVGNEVYEEFKQKFPNTKYYKKFIDDKFKIDLWQIIGDELQQMGVKVQNICTSKLCTKCSNDIFFSHRGQRGISGRLAGFMELK